MLTLVLYCIALVLFDAYVTWKRVLAHGTEVEINGIVRKAMEHFGAFKGLILGLVAPNVVLFTGFGVLHFGLPLVFMAGFRTCYAILQTYSLSKD